MAWTDRFRRERILPRISLNVDTALQIHNCWLSDFKRITEHYSGGLIYIIEYYMTVYLIFLYLLICFADFAKLEINFLLIPLHIYPPRLPESRIFTVLYYLLFSSRIHLDAFVFPNHYDHRYDRRIRRKYYFWFSAEVGIPLIRKLSKFLIWRI